MVFQNSGHLSAWICWVCIWTTNDDHLRVFIVVRNLIEIDAVVLTIISRVLQSL